MEDTTTFEVAPTTEGPVTIEYKEEATEATVVPETLEISEIPEIPATEATAEAVIVDPSEETICDACA